MTTWAFNVLRQLIAQKEIQTIWIDSGDEQAEINFDLLCTDVLAKCHHFSDRLVESADLIVYSFRDIRTAAVSARRKFGSPCTRAELAGWVKTGERWLAKADAVLQYEAVLLQPLITISNLRCLLVNKFGPEVVSDLADEDILKRVDEAFSTASNKSDIEYDKATLIIPAHRTFQPSPENLISDERDLYKRVECEFLTWLENHHYINSNDLGQEIEYHIAEKLIKSINARVVVDVGVERGSFTQLAYEAGAEHIIGFEPLPRHQEFLKAKYSNSNQVEIHPFAISDQNGSAVFHIATDFNGNELDFHHTLSDLGDSVTVKRSQKTINVQTYTLEELCARGVVPSSIDLLKIDTDGHDLNVLNGLGEIRPQIIIAEYWDNLPETSGINSYGLSDLVDWAQNHGYRTHYVVRRNGRLQSLELDSNWSVAEDWGNVIFLREDSVSQSILDFIFSISKKCHHQNLNYVATLRAENEQKEVVIRELDQALKEYMKPHSIVETLNRQLIEKEKVIQELKVAYDSTMKRLQFLEGGS